jgi:uncharacterized protein YqhQ
MEKPYIGGQAVLEGVMMRSPKSFVVAVRRPDGTIAVRDQNWQSILPNFRPLKWPFMRGALVLLESLQNGFSALTFSAEQALPEEPARKSARGDGRSSERDSGSTRSTAKPAALQARAPNTLGGASNTNKTSSAAGIPAALLMLISAVLVVGLFIAAPHLLTYGLSKLLQIRMDTQGFLFHLVDGAFRIAILLGYILAIAQTKQAERLFQYHGAEHKAIWTYESGKPLTVENAQKFGRQHPIH